MVCPACARVVALTLLSLKVSCDFFRRHTVLTRAVVCELAGRDHKQEGDRNDHLLAVLVSCVCNESKTFALMPDYRHSEALQFVVVR